MRLILGSQSPRRKEILSFFSLPFEQASPDFTEELVAFQGDPVAYAKVLSEGKALSLIPPFPQATILSADTIVYCKGQVFNKPSSEHEAQVMLGELSGQWHDVYTSVSATKGNQVFTECEKTRVLFHELSPEQIHLYHKAFHGLDKAGGYGIQDAGALIIKKIEGCFYNVMGLPLNALRDVLAAVGIDLWHHLAKK